MASSVLVTAKSPVLRMGPGNKQVLRQFLLKRVDEQKNMTGPRGPYPHLQAGQDMVVVKQGAEVHVG